MEIRTFSYVSHEKVESIRVWFERPETVIVDITYLVEKIDPLTSQPTGEVSRVSSRYRFTATAFNVLCGKGLNCSSEKTMCYSIRPLEACSNVKVKAYFRLGPSGESTVTLKFTCNNGV